MWWSTNCRISAEKLKSKPHSRQHLAGTEGGWKEKATLLISLLSLQTLCSCFSLSSYSATPWLFHLGQFPKHRPQHPSRAMKRKTNKQMVCDEGTAPLEKQTSQGLTKEEPPYRSPSRCLPYMCIKVWFISLSRNIWQYSREQQKPGIVATDVEDRERKMGTESIQLGNRYPPRSLKFP